MLIQRQPVTATAQVIEGHPGAILTLSADGDASGTGILWMTYALNPPGEDATFSNRPFRVKRFQTIHHYSVDVASLIGHSGSSAFRLSTTTVSMSLTGSCFSSESAPGALPSWDSRTRRNNLWRGLAVR